MYGRELPYYEWSIEESDIHHVIKKMVNIYLLTKILFYLLKYIRFKCILCKQMLPKKMSELYRHWKNGDTIQLSFMEKSWKIKIEFSGDDCYLIHGWKCFVEESGMEKKRHYYI